LGEFRAPFVDGAFEYRARRLDAGLNLWRSGQQILTVQAHLPLDLSLVPVARRQLPDTLSVRATADSVDLSVLEAVTPALRQEQLAHPVLDLRIAANQFKALDLKNNVTITLSGQLALRGPLFGAALKGRANVTSGVLYFADLVQKRIVNLDELADTSLAAIIQQQRLGPEFQNVFLDSLRIDDLELEMGSDVWLRSNEANIQLTGSAHLTKQRNLYLVSGTLQAARGTYRLKLGPVTREFVVSQGTVKYF